MINYSKFSQLHTCNYYTVASYNYNYMRSNELQQSIGYDEAMKVAVRRIHLFSVRKALGDAAEGQMVIGAAIVFL
jgi:hypothetical protein